MQTRHLSPHSFERRFILIVLGIVLCGNRSDLVQAAGEGPVEELRQTLSSPLDDPAKRDWDLKDRIASLSGIDDLRRALTLREWRDDDQDQKVAVIDRANRRIMVRRFEQAVREALQHGNEASRLDVLSMLAEIGTAAHGVDTRRGIARDFAPDLVELIKQSELSCCAAALRTLGQIDPEPEIALSGFTASMTSGDVNQRLAAADGLLGWMRTTAQLAMLDSRPDGVEVSRADFVAVAWAIIPLAARGLRAQQPEIRRRGAETIGYGATALHNWVVAARASAQRRTEDFLEAGGIDRIGPMAADPDRDGVFAVEYRFARRVTFIDVKDTTGQRHADAVPLQRENADVAGDDRCDAGCAEQHASIDRRRAGYRPRHEFQL